MKWIVTLWAALIGVAVMGQSTVRQVPNVASLIQSAGSANSPLVETAGYYTPGDGGGGTYRWAAGYTGTTNALGGALAVSGGAWVLLASGDVAVEQFGAVGDGDPDADTGTDDAASINAAVQYAASEGLTVRLASGKNYMLRSSVVLPSNASIESNDNTAVLIKGWGADSGPSLKPDGLVKTLGAIYPGWAVPITVGVTNITLRGFTLRGATGRGGPLLYLDSYDNAVVRDIRAIGSPSQNDWAVTFRGHNTRASGIYVQNKGFVFQDGIHVLGGTNGVIANSVSYSSDDAVVLGSSRDQHIADWSISNIVGGSEHGQAFRITTSTNTVVWAGQAISNRIERISLSGLTMYGGLRRNSVGLITESWDETSEPSGPGMVRDISLVGCVFRQGDEADHDGVNPWGIRIVGGQDISLTDVTVNNSIRSAISAEGTTRLRVIGGKYGPIQSTSSAYQPAQFNNSLIAGVINQDIAIIGGEYIATNTQTGITFGNANNVRVIGATVRAGINGITFGANTTNTAAIGNYIDSPTAIRWETGASFFARTSANTFGPSVVDEYSGTPSGILRIDSAIIYDNSDLRPFLSATRGAATVTHSWIGSRYIINPGSSSAGAIVGTSASSDNANKQTWFGGQHYDTDQLPAIGLRVSTSLTNNGVTIGYGTFAGNAATSVAIGGASNTTTATGTRWSVWTPTGHVLDLSGSSSTPDASAVSELKSTTKGFLPPRMTTAQRVAISGPATGLAVYDTDLNKLCVYDGTLWQVIGQRATSTLTTSGGDVTVTGGNRATYSHYWAADGDANLVFTNTVDGDTGTLLVRAASTNVTLTLTDAFAYSPSGSTLTVTGGTNNWSVVAWEARTINSNNVVLVNLGDYSR